MIILTQDPPNIEAIKEVLKPIKNTIYAYGSIIYNPDNAPLDDALMSHELIHSQQQGKDPARWWSLYLKDPVFRASQEIPAYQVQFQQAKKVVKDRNVLHKYLSKLAMNLSSEMYGKVMTFGEAYEAIKKEELFDLKKL